MSKLDWKSYEELVKDIYEQLGSASGVKILGYGNGCKRKGKSGVEHQIDVLTSHSDGLHDYITDIECKFWDQHINKDTVMKVREIVEDCNFSKGIIVSKLGFTPDAIQYASHVGIGLVELREMTDEDWKGRIRNIVINIDARWPELTHVQVNVEQGSNEKETMGPVHGDPSLMVITYPDGSQTTMNDFIQNTFFKALVDSNATEPTTIDYPFEQGTTISYQACGPKQRIRSMSLSGYVDVLTSQDVIRGDDEILYYMKCIFEKAELTIGKDGRIHKH